MFDKNERKQKGKEKMKMKKNTRERKDFHLLYVFSIIEGEKRKSCVIIFYLYKYIILF